MSKEIRLSIEEKAILKKLNNDQLRFLIDLKDNKGFHTFSQLVNYLIEQEQGYFFGENEGKFTPEVLYAKHAYARGGIAKLILLLHIIIGSQTELELRSKKEK